MAKKKTSKKTEVIPQTESSIEPVGLDSVKDNSPVDDPKVDVQPKEEKSKAKKSTLKKFLKFKR